MWLKLVFSCAVDDIGVALGMINVFVFAPSSFGVSSKCFTTTRLGAGVLCGNRIGFCGLDAVC